MVRTVVVETHPFNRVKNYFIDSLLYQENSKVVKELLPDNIDSGNEADMKLGEDPTATFDEEPIVAYSMILIVIIPLKMMTNGS